MEENKKKALTIALSQIEKSFGKGSIMKVGHSNQVFNIETISTGALSLNMALGGGDIQKVELQRCMVQSHRENNVNFACHCRSSKEWRTCLY